MTMRAATVAFAAAVACLALAGATARAAERIAPTYSNLEIRENAEATYAANAYIIIHMGDGTVVNEKGSSWRPVRGLVYRYGVERDTFFMALGRPDLADQFLTRRTTGRLVKWTGYTFAVGGLVATFWGWGTHHGAVGFVGLGSLIGGAVAREIGESLLEPSYPEDRAVDMAAQYNEGLRKRLGVASGGAGLSVGGRF
jgi:hypothetical protein